ncbi:amino acid transporter AVT1A-like [Asterias rubens]|uniref:amino acid transporter AVT1A-like n=1 Tax=Asterias rubens TaxID=7604 RepID=UPI001455477B|nr:amino acid transporter AVT1A-like [Asterias rubens]
MADKATEHGQELHLLKSSRTRLYQEQDEDSIRDLSAKGEGLSVIQTVLSLSACTCGYGSMVTSVLVVSTGWLGLVTGGLVYSAVVFTMVLLARCWNMVREKYPTERHPYGAISSEALGSRAGTVVNILLVCVCFLSGAAIPLAGSELIMLLGVPVLRGYFCYFPVAIGIVACLLTILKTPKNIWLVSLLSFSCNIAAATVVLFGMILSNDGESSSATNDDTPDDETPLLHLAEIIGVLIYITGVHYILPTIQQDMKEPSDAGKVVIISACVNTVAFLPIIITVFIIYGSTRSATGNASALTLLPDGAFKTIGSSLIMVHLIQVILLCNNPLYQFLEEKLDIPSGDFSWKRLVLRPLVILLQIFLLETVPQVNLYFAIVGGCFLPSVGLFLPALCYTRLKRIQLQENGISKTPKLFLLETFVCWLIMGLTPLIMATVLYVTVSEMVAGRTVFTVPCYVNATLAHP